MPAKVQPLHKHLIEPHKEPHQQLSQTLTLTVTTNVVTATATVVHWLVALPLPFTDLQQLIGGTCSVSWLLLLPGPVAAASVEMLLLIQGSETISWLVVEHEPERWQYGWLAIL